VTREPARVFDVGDDLYKTASKKNELPTSDELQAATLRWFQHNKPDMCQAKLVVDFDKKGWIVLFTPPYTPDLQPIELYWAAGKNWARSCHSGQSQNLEVVVKHLREGWYGNADHPPANPAGMVLTSLKYANSRVVLDEFLSGTIESGLVVSDDCELELGTDSIGRVTRVMCRRALTKGDLEPEVDEDGDDEDGEDEDGEDEMLV
jgi:hypothetical protein